MTNNTAQGACKMTNAKFRSACSVCGQRDCVRPHVLPACMLPERTHMVEKSRPTSEGVTNEQTQQTTRQSASTPRAQDRAFRPERIMICADLETKTCPESATDTDGTVVPCLFKSGHQGPHRFIRCVFCGETFEISETDPHWSRGSWCCPSAPLLPRPHLEGES